MEKLDKEVAQEGQWSVSMEPQGPTQSPLCPLNAPLTGGATGPSQGSNTEGEQSSIVFLPVALTLKVGREDSQAVLFPHPVPLVWKSSQGIPNAWGGRAEGLPLSPVGTHREEPHSASIRNTWHPLCSPPLLHATGGCFGLWTRPSVAPDKRGLSPFC